MTNTSNLESVVNKPLLSEPEVIQNSITLYDVNTIGKLTWPETHQGRFAKKFLEPLIKNGLSEYLSNIDGEMFALKIDDHILPILLPRDNKMNSYVCSPYHHYITFGKEHLNLLNNPFLIKMLKAMLSPIEKMANLGNLNSVVYVNHWLSATDIYPNDLNKMQLDRILRLLQARFPDRAILFRSLNSISTPPIASNLKELKCHLIPSRYVYLTNAADEKIFQTRIVKSDLRLWNQSPLEYVDEKHAKSGDCADFFKLERLLYVIQHTDLHPQYKESFIDLLFANQLLQFKSLRRDGKCVGVAGYFERDGVMYCPFLGFDKQDIEHSLIFRLLNTALLLEAKEQKCLFHQSAGASFYKSVRRAEGTLEYLAVFSQHLPRKQRTAWYLLTKFINAFGPNLMRRY